MTLSHQARADLHVWQLFLYTFNGKSMFLDKTFMFSSVITFYSGASNEFGFAAVFGKKYMAKSRSLVKGIYHFNLPI